MSDIDAPHPDDHVEIPVRDHLSAVKELLGWSRKAGFRFEEAHVGNDGIRLIGVVDDFPQVRAFAKPAVEDDVEDHGEFGKRPDGPR